MIPGQSAEPKINLESKGHRPKTDSINIESLHALNTCAEQEKQKLKSQNLLKNAENDSKNTLMEKDIIEIMGSSNDKLAMLQKGRSSGESTPNKQIFSAGKEINK